MIFAIGLVLALVGYFTWMLDVRNPRREQLRFTELGQFVVQPRWWGFSGFIAMVFGCGAIIASVVGVAWRWLP